MLAFALSGVYTIVDGLFVGNVLGDIGLATVNLSYPMAAFIQALGTGIGLAGAIRFTIFKARGDTGVGDGSQPLISRYYGEHGVKDVKQIRSLSYKTGIWLAIACTVALFAARNDVGRLFGASDLVSQDVARILPLFLASIILLSFIRVTTSYLYATEKSRLSYILVYMEPLLLLVLLFTLPPIVGLSGVWVAVPLSQVITWVLAIITKNTVDIQGARTA